MMSDRGAPTATPATTGTVAALLGIHPNTLRWYEAAGYLPEVPRTRGGYRQYSPELVRLAGIVRESQPLLRIYGPIRRAGFVFLRGCREECVALERRGDVRAKVAAWTEGAGYPLPVEGADHAVSPPGTYPAYPPYRTALARLAELKDLLEREHRLALDALEALERFRRGDAAATRDMERERAPSRRGVLSYIGPTAADTGLSRDRIINWERDGLCRYPRSEAGYRLFGADERDRLLIIRSCRTAGYSITAIRRLMRAVEEASPVLDVPTDAPTVDVQPSASGPDALRTVADTPTPQETALFSVFPTDTLPSTLERLIALTERLETIIRAG